MTQNQYKCLRDVSKGHAVFDGEFVYLDNNKFKSQSYGPEIYQQPVTEGLIQIAGDKVTLTVKGRLLL